MPPALVPPGEVQYQYDVFLSYRRANEWPRFVQTIFLPLLRHWLEAEMGEPPRIFCDVEDLETGQSWPHRLAASIASSKVMVCLWSNEYFTSQWCLEELGHMLARSESTMQTSPAQLILAVIIHDGENISRHLGRIQQFHIQEYANPWLAPGSPKLEKLSDLIRIFSAHVSPALQRAPACDPAWSDLATEKFVRLLEHGARQDKVPRFGQVAL